MYGRFKVDVCHGLQRVGHTIETRPGRQSVLAWCCGRFHCFANLLRYGSCDQTSECVARHNPRTPL